MGYFDSSEVNFPSHPDLAVTMLASKGLEAETIALLQYLPYANSEVEMSVWTMPYNYLEDDPYGGREVKWDGLYGLSPRVIRLTRCQNDEGRTIIYDLRSKAMIQWSIGDGYTNSYLELPSIPPSELFAQWIGYLRELKEIPWRSKNLRMINSMLPGPPSSYLGLSKNESPVTQNPTDQYDRNNLNEYLAMKRLYLSHGWPDNFRKEEFEVKQREWQVEFDRLEEAKVMTVELSRFLHRTAGEGAWDLVTNGQ